MTTHAAALVSYGAPTEATISSSSRVNDANASSEGTGGRFLSLRCKLCLYVGQIDENIGEV